jgi:hypothetical protein
VVDPNIYRFDIPRGARVVHILVLWEPANARGVFGGNMQTAEDVVLPFRVWWKRLLVLGFDELFVAKDLEPGRYTF